MEEWFPRSLRTGGVQIVCVSVMSGNKQRGFLKELNTRPAAKELFQCYLRKLITTVMAKDNG